MAQTGKSDRQLECDNHGHCYCIQEDIPRLHLKNIYILFVGSQLEQSASVWHSALTQENKDDIERVQKSALKIILQEKYHHYKKALALLDIETVENRREDLCLNFARKGFKNKKLSKIFPLNNKTHNMKTRDCDKYGLREFLKEFTSRTRLDFQDVVDRLEICIMQGAKFD